MVSISKRASGAWQNTSYGIRGTATDTITTLPTTIYSDGTNATVSVYGNTIQNGTPAPDSPIMPQGTGERTGNLWTLYPNQTYRGVTFEFANNTIKMNNTCTQEGNLYNSINLKAGTYTIAANANINISENIHILQIYKANVVLKTISLSDMISGKATFTIAEDTTGIQIRIHIMSGVDYSGLEIQPMLNTGSTALPFEPYGYKIPISSASTTTPVYLGEVETTRWIKKLVLDGTETITEESTNVYSIPIADTVTAEAGLSTHFEYDSTVSAGQFRIEAGKAVFGYNDTLANFSTFLAAQYAAGTPVCVWYVLATEETAVVNEPLMKIDGYADEVTGISISTTDGANTLSVDTTVQPSEVNVNYHGWHMGTVHERTAGQWD